MFGHRGLRLKQFEGADGPRPPFDAQSTTDRIFQAERTAHASAGDLGSSQFSRSGRHLNAAMLHEGEDHRPYSFPEPPRTLILRMLKIVTVFGRQRCVDTDTGGVTAGAAAP